jgi:long-chain acyl-CoA synthetase
MNVANLIADRIASNPGHPAIIHGENIWSGGELLEKADAIAAFIRNSTSVSSPRVALFAPNGPEYVALALGILRAGACFIPVPVELSPSERSAVILTTAPQLVLAQGRSSWLPETGCVAEHGGIRFEWCRCDLAPSFPEERFRALRPAFIRFSSGTTGSSKGVVIGHEALLARVRSANRRLGISQKDRVLWTLSMAHHFAVSIVLYLLQSATTVLEDSHLAAEVLTTARDSKATVFYGSPFHLAQLAAEDSGRDWPTLRLAVGTAAAVPRETSENFLRRFGVAPAQGLGIIEVGLPLLNTEAPDSRPESVGRPDDIEAHIADLLFQPAPAGELGELWLRGPGMFDAYLSPWTERRDATRDGWFSTGDLATRDGDGFIFLRGRKKSVINFGGMKFFPEEVEVILNAHPSILESRVFPEPHERWGSIAVAEIVPRDPANPPKSPALAKHCREFLAAYKIPVRFVLVEKLARTASGKLRR